MKNASKRTGDRLSDNSLVVNATNETNKDGDWLADPGVDDVAKFRPGPGWVLLEREERVDRVGRIHLAGKTEKERRYRPTPARVVKVGAPWQHERTGAKVQMELRAGDRVALRRFSGHDVLLGGREYVVAAEADVDLVLGESDVLQEV